LSTLNNYGTITVGSNYNGNWTINNYGNLNFNININSGKVVNNFSTMNVTGARSINGTLNSNGTLVTNNNLTFNSNSIGILDGVSTIGGSTTFNGGNISINRNTTISGSATFNGANVTITGNTSINGSATFNNSSTVTLSGSTSVGGEVTVNSNIGLSGSFAVGGATIINSFGGFYSMNSNQCNNISFNGPFTSNSGTLNGNNLDYGGTGSSLFVNKLPSGNSNLILSGGAIVGSCSSIDCLEVVQITASYSERDMVYIFKCSGVLELPEFLEGEEIIDAMALVVAGGGGAGRGASAGNGGAGGVLFLDGLALQSNTEYKVVVGGGGRGSSTNSGLGLAGGSSSFFGLTSLGGGGGSSSMAGSNGAVQGAENTLGSTGNSNTSIVLDAVEDIVINEYGAGGVAGANGGSPGRNGIVVVRVSFKILPVEFVDFKAEYLNSDNGAALTWSTAKEWENSHFEIERSMNGIKDFKKVGEVQGMGWKDSVSEYEFRDNGLPLKGSDVYYRLKQIDFNGRYSYSKVVSVKVPGAKVTQGVWRAYPNPTNGESLHISLLDNAGYSGENMSFRIIHPTLISNPISVNSESQMNEALAKMVGGIPKGVFVIEIRWGQKVEHIKVLKK
jgi:hypothetical protein